MAGFDKVAVAAPTPNATPQTVAAAMAGNSRFKNGIVFTIVPSANGIYAIQYADKATGIAAVDARRYACLFTGLGPDAFIRLDRYAEHTQRLDADDNVVELDGTFDVYMRAVLARNANMDAEQFAAALTQQLAGVDIRVRRKQYTALSYGQRKPRTVPVFDFVDPADAQRLNAPQTNAASTQIVLIVNTFNY